MYDLIIIGGGPAGLTAAVYAARKKMNTLLLTKEFGGQLMWTKEIENYMGYQFISGPELMGKFEEQVKRFAVDIQYEEVNGFVVNPDDTFLVKTEMKEYQSKTVILATGKRPRGLDIPGEKEFTGRGVSYCATCDGPFFDNKAVAVIGGGNSAVQAALELSKIAHTVYLVVRNNHYIADPIILEKMKVATNIIEMLGYESEGIYGDEVVEKITIREIATGKLQDIAVDGVFVEIGLEPNSEYVEDIIRMNKRKELMVDCRSRTNIPGVYAAGDITDGPDKQIVIAAGDGAKAALMAYDYLLHKE
ncbi:NAD(P)/FAD-dependent oxidoreductase [Pelosinus propionicus]|uniref:Alkyl hydroperoxide reductase subunit F n=1 Tax=Pelosinus propionicus DSM 13327 TaxID=1123291 RepID=A0A1I4PBY9_9FIRM|nr:FAD-dependent oxidoreductase [Pelosinus propionicus]SFM25282.1 alkyl hydroperoxide reductase subunit F [Pelosinus propionicus DSM 13327]